LSGNVGEFDIFPGIVGICWGGRILSGKLIIVDFTFRQRRSVVHLGFGKGGGIASARSAYLEQGSGTEPPTWSRGRAPGQEVREVWPL